MKIEIEYIDSGDVFGKLYISDYKVTVKLTDSEKTGIYNVQTICTDKYNGYIEHVISQCANDEADNQPYCVIDAINNMITAHERLRMRIED